MKRAQQKDVRIGSAGYGYCLSFEIFHFRNRGIFAHQRRPLRTGINADGLDGIAVGLSNERGRTRSRPEIDALAVQQLQRFIAAQTLRLLHGDSVGGEILLQKFLIA